MVSYIWGGASTEAQKDKVGYCCSSRPSSSFPLSVYRAMETREDPLNDALQQITRNVVRASAAVVAFNIKLDGISKAYA